MAAAGIGDDALTTGADMARARGAFCDDVARTGCPMQGSRRWTLRSRGARRRPIGDAGAWAYRSRIETMDAFLPKLDGSFRILLEPATAS